MGGLLSGNVYLLDDGVLSHITMNMNFYIVKTFLSFYLGECMCFYDCMFAVCTQARRVLCISCTLLLHV